MEPIEYLRLLQRRWRLLAACILLAATAAWITAPADDSDAVVRYEADTTIVRDSRAAAPQALSTVQLFMRTGEVPRRVADRVDFDGNPLVLARGLDLELDDAVGTLTVTATGNSPAEAAELANVVADETLAFLGEQAQAQQQEAIDASTAQVVRLQAEIDELQGQITVAEAAGLPTDLLKTQRDAKLTQYGTALAEQGSLADEPAPSAGYLVLEPAAPELASPADGGFAAPRSRPVRAGLGVILGLLFGAASILLVERVDPRLFTREQVEEAFGLPVVAEIPDAAAGEDEIVTLTEPASAITESYRSLRASLLLMPTLILAGGGARPREAGENGGGEPHVVLVTSPEPGDGKTTTVANLAAGFAEAGRSVLVLGCDFRRPMIHRYFDAANDRGLADVLTGRTADLGDVIQATSVPGVRLAASGQALTNLGDVASAGRQMVARARSHADVVLVDTAPLLATVDATELIPAVDSVVVVCRVGKTTVEAARRTCDLLTRLGAPVVGVALVGARTNEAAYSRYYTSDPTPARRGRLVGRRRG